MEEIAKAIIAIEKELGIGAKDLLTAKTHPATYARKILCHTIKNGYSGLVPELTKMTNQTISACYKLSHLAEEQWKQDSIFLGHLNNVRKHLGLYPLERKEHAGTEQKSEAPRMQASTSTLTINDGPKPFSKSPLGPEYSELDEIRIKHAKIMADRYMVNYGSGIKPLKAGYATKRQL